MKTLIEKSIKIPGIGHPDTKTVFNIDSEQDKKDLRFKSLTVISGRKLSILFDYDEDGEVKSSRIQLTIPQTNDEEVIKQFILDQINSLIR